MILRLDILSIFCYPSACLFLSSCLSLRFPKFSLNLSFLLFLFFYSFEIFHTLPVSFSSFYFIMNLLGVNAIFLLIFPTVFKQARVTPLLNKPTLNTSVIENYRPVSLLPFIAKTLERVFFNHVSLFLSQNNKLDAKQSGFRSAHSTETALISVTKALRIAKADSKSSVLRICLPLLTLSIIRSSCPPSHYWASLGFHFAGLNPI